MAEEASRDILVLGTAYVPSFSDSDTTLLTHRELTRELTQSLIQCPVYIEHDTEYQVGDVMDAYLDERKNLKALLHVYGNPLVNQILPHALEKVSENGEHKRYYESFSLGNKVLFEKDEDTGIRISGKIPQEVSICRKGDIPGTDIDDYWVVPRSMSARQYAQENLLGNFHRFYTD